MLGALVIVVVMVLGVPVATMFAGAIWSAVFGWLQPGNVEPADQ